MNQSKSDLPQGSKRVVAQIMTTARTLSFIDGHLSRIADQGVEYHVIANFDATNYEVGNLRHHVGLSRRILSLGDVKAIWEIRRMLKEIQPELVIVSTPKASLIGAVAKCLLFRKVQTIFLVRGFRFPTLTGIRRWLVRRMETLPSYLVDEILVTSKETGKTLGKLVGKKNAKKIRVVLNGTGNGIDIEHFSPDNTNLRKRSDVRADLNVSSEHFMVLAVGRICIDKGFQELVEAFEIASSKVKNMRLVVVGEYYQPDALPQSVIDKLEDRAHLVGRVPNRDLPEILNAADLFVYPSRREGFGVAAIEAAAMRLPTLAARVGGLQSAVRENYSGEFFEPMNALDLADRLVHLATDPETLQNLREKCRPYAVEHFDERLYDKFWMEIYKPSS